jgi:hypothetical protein
LNDGFLAEEDYEVLVTNAIESAISECNRDKLSERTKWEYIKYYVRKVSMKYGKARAKLHREERVKAEKDYAAALRDNHPDLLDIRIRLSKFYSDMDDAIRFRSRIEVAESGERITPFFFRQIEINRSEGNVDSLVNEEFPGGTQSREDTMSVLHTHFQNEFAEPNKDGSICPLWWENVPRLSDDESAHLDREISANDLATVILKEMKSNKAPGSDGLTVNFYRKFWYLLHETFRACMKESIELGELTQSQKESVIRLIEKKGKSRTDIKGWRPISLLNIDTKIFSKAVANRLRTACSKVVSKDQYAYVEGRVLQESHLLIQNAIERARSKKWQGFLLCVDFRGAFDRVRHSFLWEALERMNIGDRMISHLKVLYKNSRSAVMNFGTQTDWFSLERSCRQGDPVAPYLFILGMEVLLAKIRTNVNKVNLGNYELGSLAFADDLSIFVNSQEELT